MDAKQVEIDKEPFIKEKESFLKDKFYDFKWWVRTKVINPWFLPLRNFWRFRKVIADFRDWDSGYNMDLFIESLKYTEKCIRKNAIHVSAEDDADNMARLIELHHNINDRDYFERVGGNHDAIKFNFVELNKSDEAYDHPRIDNEEPLYEMVKVFADGHSEEKDSALWEKAFELEKKEIDEFNKLITRFREWWD